MTAQNGAKLHESDRSVDVRRRFGGLDRLFGASAVRRVSGAHVVVVGIGGVGSWAAEALARSGVGRLTLVDMDHIAESNINRQIHALDTTLGQSKGLAMRDRIADIHPGCEVMCIDEFVDAHNWPSLLGTAHVDGVIDACDNVQAKTAIAAWARRTGTLFVTSGAAGGKRLAHKVEIDDLARTTHDPLLAQVRYRLRKHYNAPRAPLQSMHIACVFSREAVVQPSAGGDGTHADGSLNCAGYGSTVAVTATFGFCAAGWMLNSLTGAKTNV